MRIDHCASSPLGLVVALGGAGPPPRLPKPVTFDLLGVALPCLELDPRTSSACAKVRLALSAERVE
jgi:hypothetical protein